MVFTAYDQVHFTQYDNYQKYAQMTPGDASRRLAQEIAWNEPKGSVAQVLTAELTARKWALNLVAQEFYIFAIISASGNGFDVYLLDEDSLFEGCMTEVPAENVLQVGEQLMSVSAA